jgi:hypothetical protein
MGDVGEGCGRWVSVDGSDESNMLQVGGDM